MSAYQVYLGACPAYDSSQISDHIQSAIFGFDSMPEPKGLVVIKPNLVLAHPHVATEGFTRPEVVEGIVRWLLQKSYKIECVKIVEKSGLGVTTASMYRWANYHSLKNLDVRLVAMEESRRSRVVLEKGKIHRHININEDMAKRDFLIFAPKLKSNVLSDGLSGALKLNIGTIDSKERLFHHHKDLPIKIVDILEAANPDLIVTDGIRFSFGGNQMTQHGTDLGVVLIANNVVAHDMIAARLLNLDPFKIKHIKEAVDRGYGPKSLDEIEVTGDFKIQTAQAVTSELDLGLMPIHQFPSHFKIRSGSPYCAGGCHGIFLDWLHMVKDRQPGQLKRFPKIPVIIGKVMERVTGSTVLLVGDCAFVSPSIRANRIVRISGCPPTHKKIVLSMLIYFFLLAPLVRPSLIWDSFVLYPLKWIKGRLINIRYRPTSTGDNGVEA